MTRAAFNTTCDVYSGPGSATPGILVGTFACRLVSDAAILLVGTDAPVRLWYLTVEDYTPVGAWASPMISLDASLADLVAVPSGTDPRFLTLFTEAIDWQGQAVYQRANLVEMPEDYWTGYGLIVGSADELLDVGLVVGPLDEEEEEEEEEEGGNGGETCETGELIVSGVEYETTVPAGETRFYYYPNTTGLAWSIDYDCETGGSIVVSVGTCSSAENATGTLSGEGTFSDPGGTYFGLYIMVQVSAAGVDATSTWTFEAL